MSEKHLAGSPTWITGPETAAISQVVAISMATLCDGYLRPHFTDEKTDAQGGERTGPRLLLEEQEFKVMSTCLQIPPGLLSACFSVLSSASRI